MQKKYTENLEYILSDKDLKPSNKNKEILNT